MNVYMYKANSYGNLYDLSEALGKDGIFIPRSINNEALAELGVTIMREEEPLENVKQYKIMELKRQRDTAEVTPIEYNGNLYDYDEKARDRINVAIVALGDTGSLMWTTADNKDVSVTATDLRGVLIAVAVRSNELHIRYRNAKAKVEEAQTAEELEAIEL